MRRSHAVARLSERFGVREHGVAIIASLKARIMTGEAKFSRHLNDGLSEWVVHLNGKRIRVVWSERNQYVVTVIPGKRPRAPRFEEG